MKKTLTTIMLGALSLSCVAQDPNYPGGCVVEIFDTDGDFTNVRNGAGGAVVDKLPTNSTYRFELTDGKSDSNGWVWIKNGKVFSFDPYGYNEPENSFAVTLKGSSTGYWVHNSVLRVFSDGEGVVLREKPDKTSAIKYEVSHTVKLRPLRVSNDYIYLKTSDGKHEGWAPASGVCFSQLMHGEETDSEYDGYPNMHYGLNRSFKVNGGVGIESFVEAIGLGGIDGWSNDPVVDKANGFFNYSEEGDGSVNYYAVYWNRSDGKKLFMVSYRVIQNTNVYFDQEDQEDNFGWYKIKVIKDDNSPDPDYPNKHIEEVGCIAYLYNPSNQKLEPMGTPPFNAVQKTDDLMFLELPRQGKDIKVIQYNINSPENITTHTLKFNGLNFNYMK